jgi:hypothetical protein
MSEPADTTADRRGRHIVATVTGWDGIETDTGEYQETDFLLRGRTIGHIHSGHQADIPFPKRVRDELVAQGRTGPHHVLPDSGWTTLYIRSDADADTAIELLRINYDRITRRHRAAS